ncbi:ABCC8 isoform 17, partial [Pan troglodytes]
PSGPSGMRPGSSRSFSNTQTPTTLLPSSSQLPTDGWKSEWSTLVHVWCSSQR